MQPCSGGRIGLLGKGEKIKTFARTGCRRDVLINPKFQAAVEIRYERRTIKNLALRRLAGSRETLSIPLAFGHKRIFQEWSAPQYHKFVILAVLLFSEQLSLAAILCLSCTYFYCFGIRR
jgi:hypothetical protein